MQLVTSVVVLQVLDQEVLFDEREILLGSAHCTTKANLEHIFLFVWLDLPMHSPLSHPHPPHVILVVYHQLCDT